MTRWLTLSLHVYRWLLWAYPAEFRHRFAREMTLVFRDTCRAALHETGSRGLLAVWFRTTFDLLLSAYRERLLALGVKHTAMTDIALFDRQLVGTLTLLTTRLRSGYSVLQIVEMIAEIAPEPTASEFRRLREDIVTNELPWPETIAALGARVPSAHLQIVIDTMERQRQQGGNLANDLQTVLDALRAAVDGIDWTPPAE